jgi:hypothetical protein
MELHPPLREKHILDSAAESVGRVVEAQSEVGSKLDLAKFSRSMDALTDPKSPGSTMKKAGVALIAAPEPITGVAGVVLVASSVALRKNEPASLSSLAQETRKLLREIQSFRI